MRAAVVERFDQDIQLEDVPIPDPGAGQVLVRIEASGLCHTDIHAAHGDWPVTPHPPFIPGHEGVGIVEKLGDDVQSLKIGDRVALAWLGHACGHCEYCIDGRETLCLEQQNTGYSINGAFAEYAVADANYAVKVPDGIAPVDAAPLTCAGVTTYKAIKVARITPTERVVIFGIGGLGHLALQYAHIVGGLVSAVDVTDEKLELARELGADQTINAAHEDPVAALEAIGGADVAVVLAANSTVFDQAYRSLRRGGRLVCVALPKDGSFPLPIFDLVLGGKSVVGSIVGTREDLREVFALHAAGRTRVITETRELDDVAASMKDVLAGTVPARVVFRLS